MARGDTLIGERLGQYRITGVLGRGGMATVYRATQERLGRDVALKVLRAAPDDPQATARFEREARSVARLSHPNILPVYDYGEEHGARYIATQLIEGGRSLATRLGEGPVAPAEAAALVAPVLDALEYAHGQGVIHRDIKPANILLPRPDWPLLGDFGIAQSLAEQTQLTGAGEIIGTPSYMAPERSGGQPSDARADLYAVGVVLYELLTGGPPFTGEPMAVLIQHIRDEPRPPSARNPAVYPSLERVILRALAKDPADRFQSAAEMAAALRAAAAVPATPVPIDTRELEPEPLRPGPWPEELIRQRTPPPPDPRPRTARRGLPALLLAGGLIALLTAGALLWAGGWTAGPGAGLPLTLDDAAWSGGYRGPFRGGPTYGGRTGVVVYGTDSGLSEISAAFQLSGRPRGDVALTLEGMDSEGPAKTEIVIAVNGQTIYNGANPLPDDDYVFETGTWASHRFPFDPRLLRAGANTVTITNRSPGGSNGPPFIFIDYATIE